MMNSLHHEKERIKNNFLRRHVHINFEVDVFDIRIDRFLFFFLVNFDSELFRMKLFKYYFMRYLKLVSECIKTEVQKFLE